MDPNQENSDPGRHSYELPDCRQQYRRPSTHWIPPIVALQQIIELPLHLPTPIIG
jgi:hypothetical protein